MTILDEKSYDKRDRAVKAAQQALGEHAVEGVEFKLKKLEDSKRFYWAPLKVEQPKAKDRVYDICAKDALGTVVVAGPSACEVKWDQPEPWGKVSNALTAGLRVVKEPAREDGFAVLTDFYAGKSTSTPATDNQPDNLDIPDFLKVENREPLTPEQEAKLKEIQQQKAQEAAKSDPTLPRNIETAGLEILHTQQDGKRKGLKSQKQTTTEQEIASISGSDSPSEEDSTDMTEEVVASEETPTKVKKTRKAKTAKPAKVKAKKIDGNGGAKRVRDGAKTKEIGRLLQRKNGCTSAEILEATGWPSVSVPAMAKACGLTLRKEKNQGEKTRYWGE